jgi:hypothetical protein
MIINASVAGDVLSNLVVFVLDDDPMQSRRIRFSPKHCGEPCLHALIVHKEDEQWVGSRTSYGVLLPGEKGTVVEICTDENPSLIA